MAKSALDCREANCLLSTANCYNGSVKEGCLSRLEQLRGSFNQAAQLYDEARPGYPPPIIDTIIALAGLPAQANLLEIGCGTGQITMPFAARGYAILALELGDALAALAAEKCRPYPRVAIVPVAFEAWPLQEQAFDLVVSAQAFHWIDPEYGCSKAAAALKRGGAIALVWNLDVTEHTAFYQATRSIYAEYLPASSAGDLEEMVDRYRVELGQSAAFTGLREIRHAWEHTYSGADYIKLLHTYSNHRTLPEPDKTRFFQAIAAVIDQTGGAVLRKYETVLLLAHTPSFGGD